MGDRRARIPAGEVGDKARNWNLPFWTEPTHVVESPEDLGGEDDVLMEVAEVETVAPLTADELETIRQEAYNEGLQQGLVEGRQKGEKLGHDTGLAQGLKAGHEEGRKEGYEVGKEEGQIEVKGRAELQRTGLHDQLQAFMAALNKAMLNQQSEIENILPSLIEELAKAVVTEELSQGSDHIVHLVKQAISALPVKLKDFTIEINHNDFPFIETALEQKQFTATLESNEEVESGGCLIHSEKSTIDFTLSNRWEEVLKDYHQKLQLNDAIEQAQDDKTQADAAQKVEDSEQNSAETQTLEAEENPSAQNENVDAQSHQTQQDELEQEALQQETPQEEVIGEPPGLVDIPELIEEEYQASKDESLDVNTDEESHEAHTSINVESSTDTENSTTPENMSEAVEEITEPQEALTQNRDAPLDEQAETGEELTAESSVDPSEEDLLEAKTEKETVEEASADKSDDHSTNSEVSTDETAVDEAAEVIDSKLDSETNDDVLMDIENDTEKSIDTTAETQSASQVDDAAIQSEQDNLDSNEDKKDEGDTP